MFQEQYLPPPPRYLMEGWGEVLLEEVLLEGEPWGEELSGEGLWEEREEQQEAAAAVMTQGIMATKISLQHKTSSQRPRLLG